MRGQPSRTIQEVMIEGVGPLSISALLKQDPVAWGLWRQSITDARSDNPPRSLARCMMCDGPVYIRARRFQGVSLPHFQHFDEATAPCPWHHGANRRPDALRALQYDGRQEGLPHRLLCEEVSRLALQAPDCLSAEVSRYRRPTLTAHGRYPDVLIRRRGRPDLTVEVQLSPSFQTEISERFVHYRREGVGLLWLLHPLEPGETLPQPFEDIVLRHRGNAFVLDLAAVAASRAAKRLTLSCHLRRPDGTFEAPRLVDLDELTFPEHGLPYLEDRVTPLLLGPAKAVRRPWHLALSGRSAELWDRDFQSVAFRLAHEHLCARVPGLSSWHPDPVQGTWLLNQLIAVIFSLLSHAAGAFRNYASRQSNVKALLNSKLTNPELCRFAPLIGHVLAHCSADDLLATSVGTHLQRGLQMAGATAVRPAGPAWLAIEALCPELFDGMLRAQLKSLEAMPSWAVPKGLATPDRLAS